MLIAKAKEIGLSVEEILGAAVAGVPAGNKRRETIVEWGADLGYDASSALRLAHEAGLIPSVHPPPSVEGKPLGKGQGK